MNNKTLEDVHRCSFINDIIQHLSESRNLFSIHSLQVYTHELILLHLRESPLESKYYRLKSNPCV